MSLAALWHRAVMFGALYLATTALAGLSVALADAGLTKGERVFKKCVVCNMVEQGGKKKAGTNLYGSAGGPVMVIDGYKYSFAPVGYGGEWTVERLDALLKKPETEVKGTKMSFADLKEDSQRIDLVAYLNGYSDNLLVFGVAEVALPIESAEEVYEFGVLYDAPGVETTY